MRLTATSNPLPDDPTTLWAKDVAHGRIVAGSLVRQAAERHLRDLKEGPVRGLVWRPDLAGRALGFFPAVLSVTEGQNAGQPFKLLPWHVFVVGSLFGWHRQDGLRRFRRAWLETGKGQAKSPIMAAIGLFMMGFCGKKRAEVYAIANDREQANVLFKDAVAMCRATIPDGDEGDTLEARGEVVIRGTADNAWKIEHPESGSKFQSIASVDAISGPRPAAVLADEIHEFKSAKAIELWKAAIDKMSGDPLMLLGTNTPAVDQIVGTEYSDFFQRIVKGDIEDDAAFGFIARVDVGDDPFEDEACWPKALPALGITYPIENVRNRVKTARVLLSEALSTKRLFFGIPVGATEFWIEEAAWRSALRPVDDEELRGLPCWLSLDLSQKNDLTALSACWRHEDGRLTAKTWYWTAKVGLAERGIADHAPYDKWAIDPKVTLEAVPGATIDKEFVAAKVADMAQRHEVEFLAFDPAGIGDFIAACERIGFDVWKWAGPDEPEGRGLKLVSHAQGTRIVFEDKQLCMPRSIERLEDAILDGALTIDDSPVTTMCAANAHVKTDAQDNRAFDKKRSRGRIDGLVTLAMAVGAATFDSANATFDIEAMIA